MSSDCYGWEQVLCNSATAHIVGLSLNHIIDTTNWLLNVSLFWPFKELTSLDLSGNQIGGCIDYEDMSGNRLTWSISPYIGALSLTKAISLSDNNFNGAFPTEDLCRSKKLEELDIFGNDFEEILPQCISNMSSLRVLDISGNRYIRNCFTNICSE
ncbi:hypothetical protein I3842_Q015700 [Carya illinoinensis]|uniref:Uncharacterized protein n=1 Tax=Carya illinoinensis TaxID=32201 RepID=A0A922D7V3_CARIL|nr:hypothetical protein I3842_Q015700 [Carya illinoinensis]